MGIWAVSSHRAFHTNLQGNSLSLRTSACFSSTFSVRVLLSVSQLDFPSSLFREVGQLITEIENKEKKAQGCTCDHRFDSGRHLLAKGLFSLFSVYWTMENLKEPLMYILRALDCELQC